MTARTWRARGEAVAAGRGARIALAAAVALLVIAGDSMAAAKRIDDVGARTFRFGSLAMGQGKDLDHARAEGLGLVPRSPLDDYLNRILAQLLAQAPVRDVPARVYIRASGDWAAKTTADANIYVALGMLLRLDSEDEVAALLAHEASHALLDHADVDIVTGLQRRVLQISDKTLEVRDAIAGEEHAKEGAKPAPNATPDEQSQALLLNTMIIVPAWTRRQERDADLLGIDLLARAGYAPQAMVSLLRKQQQVEAERARDLEAHSLDQELFGVDVKEEVREQSQRAAESLGVDDPGLGKLAGGALGAVFEWGAKKVGDVQRSHPKTEERIEDSERYIAREYPGEPKAPRVAPWEAAKEQDGTADRLENYIAAIEAEDKLSNGDLAAARSLSKSALADPTRTDAYPNYVEATLDLAVGGSAASGMALSAYETALAGPEPAGVIYREASALYLATGKPDRAAEVIESGYSRLQEPPSLVLPLIRAYRLLGRQADADRVAASCAARWPQMQSVCTEEAKGP